MKNPKHNPLHGRTGASQDASGMLRDAVIGRAQDVSPRDMAKN